MGKWFYQACLKNMKIHSSKANSIALGYAKSIVTTIVVKSLSVESVGQNVPKNA